MAKKGAARGAKVQRRNTRRVEPLGASPVAAEPVAPPEDRPVQAPPTRPTSTYSQYRPASPVYRRAAQSAAAVPTDYSYVRHDLKRIGVLLGIMLIVMVGLTLVLR